MIVQVTANIRISAEDGVNYALERRSVVQSGKHAGEEKWAVLGYYGGLSHACQALLDRHLDKLVEDSRGPGARLLLKLNHVTEAIEEARRAVLAALEGIERP